MLAGDLSELITEGGHPVAQEFENWTMKRRIGRRKVSRSISGKAVRDLEAAWHFARDIAKPMNRFVTIRPSDIDGDNRVASNRIADAQINYNGKGFVSRSAKPGIIQNIFSFLGLI